MEAIFLEYEINTSKADHIFDSEIDNLLIHMTEMTALMESGDITKSEVSDFFTENAESIAASVKNFFVQLIENIKILLEKVSMAIVGKLIEMDIKARTMKLKAELASSKVDSNKKIVVFDFLKYYSACSHYIDEVSHMTVELGKQFASETITLSDMSDYTANLKKVREKYNLDKIEAYDMQLGVVEALEKMNNNVEKFKSVTTEFCNKWKTSLTEIYRKADALAKSNKEKATEILGSAKRLGGEFNSSCASIFKKLTSGFVDKAAEVVSAATNALKDAKSAVTTTVSNVKNRVTNKNVDNDAPGPDMDKDDKSGERN